MISPLGIKEKSVKSYDWSQKEREFVTDIWSKFSSMHTLRNEPIDLLGERTLQEFWDDSVRDYAVLSKELQDENDPVVEYQSTVSRDKADVFIASLNSQLLFPDVVAQNMDQEIDHVVSRVSSGVLEWAHKNDGWPSESGQQKNARYIHKGVVEGTTLVLDVVTKDGLESELIPNEEIYIKNYWQPDIQKHSLIIRAKQNITYDEAELLFGDNKNWEYVNKGAWAQGWYTEVPELKDGFEGLEFDESCQILYVWKRANNKELEMLKEKGKIKKSAKRACFYNVIVNDILMFQVDNLLPYKHGFFPISKFKFQEFAKPEFFYGNSAPNKVREDKKWLDSWKTLLRYKGKLGVLKPQLIYGGTIDEEIILPSKITAMEQGVEIKPIEGVSDGISNADISLMQMAEGEIDRGSVSPQTAGQMGARKETARATVIMASNAEKLLDTISQQLAYFQASRSFPILLSLFQFLRKREIAKIAIPDQTLKDGLRGNLELVFQSTKNLTEIQQLQDSMEIKAKEFTSRNEGKPKDIVKVDGSYLDELQYYVTADASNILQTKSVQKQQVFNEQYVNMAQDPNFDPMEVRREFIRVNQLSPRLLAKPQSQTQPSTGSMPTVPQEERATEGDQMANMMSKTTAGGPLPSLPPEL